MAVGQQVQGVNPTILRWARERSGLSLEEVAAKFKKTTEKIESWESGEAAPTHPQLERLAYELYKRPLAIFFFPEPPDEPSPRQAFRTLPEAEADALLPDSRYAIREGQAMQLALHEINEGRNPSKRLVFRDIRARIADNPVALAREVREYLGFTLELQTASANEKEALERWRDAVQDVGVFVFKRSFKQKEVSGFCLLDQEFPLIYINNSTPASRQIFTLLHELAHVLLGINDLASEAFERNLPADDEARAIETFCNQFAATMLIPNYAFDQDLLQLAEENRRFADEEAITELARKYKVSREVVVRKLLNKGLVSRNFYLEKVRQYAEEYQQQRELQREKGGGGDYYATKATYLGERFMTLVFSAYYQGRFDLNQAAEYLSIKPQNVGKLEETWSRKATF
jgi:Zn-dependent peptidase ImmA (M78 family)/transcriptional regulator with XRE-family HTH domain